MKRNEEKILREAIVRMARKAIRESFFNEEETANNLDRRRKNTDQHQGASRANMRKIVIAWLKSGTINDAEIMRRLWNPDKKHEDAKRSYFYKCRDGEPNESGVPYKFSDEEINTLYQIKGDLEG